MFKKELGLVDVFCMASGAMISSGLFILPGIAFLNCGPSVFLAYLLAAILIVPALLSKAELATAMPKSGGIYFYIDRSLGAAAGTMAGISAWFSLSFKSAFALLGIGAFLRIFMSDFPMWQIKLVAIFCCVFFTILNIYSTKHAGSFQVFLVFALLVILSLYIFRGFSAINFENFKLGDGFLIGGHKALFGTAGLIFISYGGLTKIASIAQEVKNPSQNIPLGMILAFVIVTIIYVLAIFVTVGVLGEGLLVNGSASLTPISDAANIFMGKLGMYVLAVAALLAFISTGNAGIMAASRTPMAMAKDKLLPSFFSKLNRKYKTPIASILFTSFFMIVVILFLDLQMLVKIASTLKIILFGIVNLVLIIMRESGIENYRPKFRSPLYPWIQIGGIIAYIFLLIEMGREPILIAGGFLILSYFWYWIYAKVKTTRESALLNILRRITNKELSQGDLNEELKQIVCERDEIVKDFFDEIVEKANYLDLEEELDKSELFKKLARMIGENFGEDETLIYDKFVERESSSPTVLSEGLAIPHIIIKGKKLFDIVVVRSKKGIYFSGEFPKIKAVFAIVGSLDVRMLHLRALAAIAQIVQNPNFDKRWEKAKNRNSLRDLLLLSSRKR